MYKGIYLNLYLIVQHKYNSTFVCLGWMYESRGGGSVSLSTKIWALSVKLLSTRSKPLLYSYQGSLPKLPLPPVNETMKRVIIRHFMFSLLMIIFFITLYIISVFKKCPSINER